MPIYEFICAACHKDKEVMQKYLDPPPRCGGCQAPMTKKISRTAFVLVGGGWYKDGYSKGGK